MAFALWEEIHEISHTMLGGYYEYLNKQLEKHVGDKVDGVFVARNGVIENWVCEEDWQRAGKKVFNRLLKEEAFRKECNDETIEYINKVKAFAASLPNDPSELSDKQLSSLLGEYGSLFLIAHATGQMEQIADANNNYISDYLANYVNKQAEGKTIDSGKAFAILTTPLKPTRAWKEELALAETSSERELEEHAKKYAWMWFNYEGPSPTLEFFKERRAKIKNPEKFIKEKQEEKREIKKQQEELEAKLEFDAFHKTLFAYTRDLPWFKAERKDAMYFLCYKMTPLYKEAARRSGVSLHEFRAFLPHELSCALNGKVPKEELGKRRNFSIVACIDGKEKLYVGTEAQKFIDENNLAVVSTKEGELRGHCACAGKVIGTVKILNTASEMGKVKKGDILVASQTNPNFLPAMERAAAFVTDAGGLTCHAAIVAREMRKPCVVGTRSATKTFKDGDLVEVDATAGTVRKVA